MPNTESTMDFEEFSGRLESIECPLTQELFQRFMKRIETIRALARHAKRRGKIEVCMAVDDVADELVLELESFLRENTAQGEPTGDN